jgi:hypothetical protein
MIGESTNKGKAFFVTRKKVTQEEIALRIERYMAIDPHEKVREHQKNFFLIEKNLFLILDI